MINVFYLHGRIRCVPLSVLEQHVFRFLGGLNPLLIYHGLLSLLLPAHLHYFPAFPDLVKVLPALLSVPLVILLDPRFFLTVTANRNWSNQISKFHGGSEFDEIQNTGIPMSVLLSWDRNPAGCAMWYQIEPRIINSENDWGFKEFNLI